MSGYNRVYLKKIKELLKAFPCVALLGARQVGKTTLMRKILPAAQVIDLEYEQDFQRLTHDIGYFLDEHEGPLGFDEAQLCPDLFKALRVKIDSRRDEMGQYLITGSSSPELLRNLSESLAGRVAIIEISPLLAEEINHTELSPFVSILKNCSWQELRTLRNPAVTKEELNNHLLYGGYPDAVKECSDMDAYDLWMDNYVKTYIERDIRALFPKLDLVSYRQFVKMLCFNSGNICNYSEFARTLDVSQPTIKSYFHIAEGTFLWQTLPSFSFNIKKRVLKMPKGYIRDSGLLNYMCGFHSLEALKSTQQFGRLWECYIIENLLRKLRLQVVRLEAYYYRTQHQAEIDLILTGRFGIIPIEIKSGSTILSRQLRTLSTFIEEHDCPIGIVINNADKVEFFSEKIVQVPATFI